MTSAADINKLAVTAGIFVRTKANCRVGDFGQNILQGLKAFFHYQFFLREVLLSGKFHQTDLPQIVKGGRGAGHFIFFSDKVDVKGQLERINYFSD